MAQFVGRKQISECLNLGSTTLRKYRVDGVWIEGIHWVRVNSRCVRYNIELLQDWFHNRNDPAAHQRAIDAYQIKLPSNQPKPRRKKK